MSERLACGAPATRYPGGGTSCCPGFGFRWTTTKGGKSQELVRCNDHAAALRAKGYEVHKVGSTPMRQAWDMTSLNSLEAGLAWLRKQSGALLVLAIRAGDAAIVVDQGIVPGDVVAMLEAGLQEALDGLEKRQERAAV